MNYNLIVASCNNYGIGYNGSLPWHIPNDLKRFSKLTKGQGNNAVIMGRKTWDSLPIKPLPNRINIVLTSNNELINKYKDNKEIIFLSTFDDIDNFCNFKKFDEVWVIGGVSIYKHYINIGKIKEIYMTYINMNFECDTDISFLKNSQYPFQIVEKIVDKYENTEIYYVKLIFIKKGKHIQYSYNKWNENENINGSGIIINWLNLGYDNNNNYILIIQEDNCSKSCSYIYIPGTAITYIS
jgi:dihydrofolate reductase